MIGIFYGSGCVEEVLGKRDCNTEERSNDEREENPSGCPPRVWPHRHIWRIDNCEDGCVAHFIDLRLLECL